MSHTLAPTPEMVEIIAARPPGLSETVTWCHFQWSLFATNARQYHGHAQQLTAKRTRRLSAARPRSITLPRTCVQTPRSTETRFPLQLSARGAHNHGTHTELTVMSMLPPHSGVTIVLPLNSGVSRGPPGSSAATPTAPPPSITCQTSPLPFKLFLYYSNDGTARWQCYFKTGNDPGGALVPGRADITAFSCSNRRRMAIATCFSETTTQRST